VPRVGEGGRHCRKEGAARRGEKRLLCRAAAREKKREIIARPVHEKKEVEQGCGTSGREGASRSSGKGAQFLEEKVSAKPI